MGHEENELFYRLSKLVSCQRIGFTPFQTRVNLSQFVVAVRPLAILCNFLHQHSFPSSLSINQRKPTAPFLKEIVKRR